MIAPVPVHCFSITFLITRERCWHYVWKKTLVGLIIGNIPDARERNNPDINWVPALAVHTRAHAKRKGVTSKLKTPSIIDRTITPTQLSNAQKDEVSLTTTRSRCEANETIGKATFLKKNDLLYRKFSSPNVEHRRIFTQLIVPQQYRTLVMKLAHESVMAHIWQLKELCKRYCQSSIGLALTAILSAFASHVTFAKVLYIKVSWSKLR